MSFRRLVSPNTSQNIMNVVFVFSGVLTILILIIILGYVIFRGIPAISLEFLFSTPIDSGRSGGILPMIISSIYVTAIAGLIATPLGVGAAIYMVEYAENQKLIKIIRFGAETLASIPSIIFGLFGLAFFVVFLGFGWSILSGSLVLTMMALPTIFQVSEVTLVSIPSSYKEGSYGLGATKLQTIIRVILPAALPGIITGIILAMTRAISEAAAVMFAVGSSLKIPISLFDPGRPLPLHLYIMATEGISLENAYGTAAVLVVIVLILTIITNVVVENYQKKMLGR